MKKVFLILILFMFSLPAKAEVSDVQNHLAVINIDKILAQPNITKTKDEFDEKMLDLGDKISEYTLSRASSEEILKLKQEKKEIQDRYGREMQKYLNDINKAIEKVAKEKEIYIVFRNKSVAYMNNVADLTDDVIEYMNTGNNSQKKEAENAPTTSLKSEDNPKNNNTAEKRDIKGELEEMMASVSKDLEDLKAEYENDKDSASENQEINQKTEDENVISDDDASEAEDEDDDEDEDEDAPEYDMNDIDCDANNNSCKDKKGNPITGRVVLKKDGITLIKISYKNGEREGRTKTYYPNGKIERSVNIINEKINGWAYTYYEDGKIQSKVYWKDNVPQDSFSYNPSGKLSAKTEYKNGMYNVSQYDETGNLQNEIICKEISLEDGSFNGIVSVKQYYNSGKLRFEAEYENDKLVTSKRYNEDGTADNSYTNEEVECETKDYFPVYCTDKSGDGINGTYKEYYADGTLYLEGTYKNGKPDGYIKTYLKSGKLGSHIPFKNGKIHGTMKSYHENGNLSNIAEYENGEPNGAMRFYYEDGTLLSESGYLLGKEQGISRSYYKNGNVQKEFVYSMGELKSVREYDEDGKMISVNGRKIGSPW